MRLISSLIIFVVANAFCISSLAAQKKLNVKKPARVKATQTINTRSVKRQKQKAKRKSIKTTKVISAGIVNTKAINLVKPEFPLAAKMIGAYGQITVEVLISEKGNVQEANSIIGHPFIRAASVVAARASKFEPFTFGGQAVKVRGIIIYNYLPGTFNWLEIGYILQTQESGNFHSFYTFTNLIECFPSDFENEKQLVELAWQDWENRKPVLQNIFAMIEGRLSDKPKEFWLFSLGKTLATVPLNLNDSEDLNQNVANILRSIIQTPPENISNTLIFDLEQLIFLLESPDKNLRDSRQFRKNSRDLSSIIQRMPHLGR